MYFVNKYIIIEMAHRLPEYEGACRNIHGHSWKVTATFGSEELIVDGPHRGMVADFSKIKMLLVECVHVPFDHTLTLWVKDPLFKLLKESEEIIGKLRLIQTIEPPTSEYLAKHWFESLEEFKHLALPDTVRLISVSVNETCTSEATYMPHVIIDTGEEG